MALMVECPNLSTIPIIVEGTFPDVIKYFNISSQPKVLCKVKTWVRKDQSLQANHENRLRLFSALIAYWCMIEFFERM